MPQLVVAFLATAGVPGLVGIGGVLTTTGSVLASGIGVGLSVGLSVLSGALFEQPKPEAIKALVQQSVVARSGHLGLQCGGIARAAIEDENGNLHQVGVCGEGPFTEFVAWIVDDRELELNGGGWAINDPFDGNDIHIDWRLGTPTQPAFAMMMDRLPDIWTEDHQLKGLACFHLYQDGVSEERFPKVYRNRICVPRWVAKTTPVFDPRTSSTEFSENLALFTRHLMTSDRCGRIPASLIDDDTVKIAADVCDEEGPTKAGGTIPRYHGALSWSYSEQPKAVLDRALLAMDGRTYLTRAGKIGLKAGKWVEPTLHFGPDSIRACNRRRGKGPYAERNEIIMRYTAPEARFSQAVAAPWRDEANIAAYGLRSGDVQAYEIRHPNHAARIAKVLHHRSNPAHILELRGDLDWMQAWDEQWIRLTLPIYGIDNESFEILAIGLDDETDDIVVTLQSFDGSVAYAFNPETEEGRPQAIPEERDPDPIEQPVSISVVVESRRQSEVTTTDTVWNPEGFNTPTPEDNDIFVKVLVIDWPDAVRRGLRPILQYAVSASTAWRDITVAAGASDAESPAVTLGENYVARVRFVTIGGVPSEWRVSDVVTA